MANPNIWVPGEAISANRSISTQLFIASADQTVFDLTDFSYAVGANSLYVFINGGFQVLGVDFVEISSSRFQLTAGISAGTKVAAVGFLEIAGGSAVVDSAMAVAEAAAVAAALSEANAASSEASVSASASAAAASAVSAAADAASSSINAITASNAATSAAASATAAASSEASVAASVSSATTAASAAAISETNAANSEAAAASSETNAAVSETNAAASASAAAASAATIDVANLVTKVDPTTSGTLTHSGDVLLSGSGKRITGDFSNATIANRLMLQTSTVNGNTAVGAIPNGTGSIASFVAWNGSDASNASYAQIVATAADARIISSATGTGTYLPMTLYTGGSERLQIGTSGQIGIAGANYGTSGQALVSNGSDAAPSWQTISFDLTAAFGSSLAANGYQKLPSGLIIQWGTASAVPAGVGDSNKVVALPIAYPTAIFAPFASAKNLSISEDDGIAVGARLVNGSLSTINIINTSAIAQDVFWMTIGA